MESALLPTDYQSLLWQRFTKTLKDELERLRELNDGTQNGPVETALIRGRILAVKEILALGLAPSAVEGVQPAMPVETVVELQQLGLDPTY